MSFQLFPSNQHALWKLIEERASVDSDKAAVDQRIWESFGVEGAIVFSDLAGFTRRSEEHGITHFLEAVYYSQRLLRPIIDEQLRESFKSSNHSNMLSPTISMTIPLCSSMMGRSSLCE